MGLFWTLLAGFAPQAVAAPAPLTLKFSHPQPETHVYHAAATLLGKELATLSNGSMKLEIYPNSLMGGERTVVDLVQAGSIDMMSTSTPVLGNFDKIFQMFSLPFLFKDEQHLYKSFDDPAVTEPLAASLIKRKGLRPLAYWLTGPRNFVSTKPANSLADFKGVKVRCMEDPFILATYEALGASPVAMPFPDVYTGLQTGSVSAAEIPLNTYVHNKYYEVAKNAAVTNTNYLMMLVVVSEKTWKKLNAEQKEWLAAAVKASEKFEREATEKELKALPQTLADLGVNITTPDRGELLKAVQPIYEKFKKDFGSEAASVVDRIRADK
jgi:tripartite ATP-independent transporter DctP family solute receptor